MPEKFSSYLTRTYGPRFAFGWKDKPEPKTINYLQNKQAALVSSQSGINELVKLPDFETVASIIFRSPDEFVVLAEDGRFDGQGDISKLAYWVAGYEVLEMGNFSEKYYTPGLLTELLTGKRIHNSAPAKKEDNVALQLIGKVWSIKPGGEAEIYLSRPAWVKPGSKLRVLAGKKYLTISVKKTFHTRVTANSVAGMAKGMPVFRVK